MFRSNGSFVTDASGYIYLDTNIYEIEWIKNSQNLAVPKIEIEDRHYLSGWYHDGVDTATNFKRRVMVRSNGNASTSTTYTVFFIKEYADLASTSDTPYPFVGKAFLDMLTSLQAYYYYMELGKEKIQDAEAQLTHYKMLLKLAGYEYLDDEPTYGSVSHTDAGDRRTIPVLNVSTS
jgi:hypothetical protein